MTDRVYREHIAQDQRPHIIFYWQDTNWLMQCVPNYQLREVYYTNTTNNTLYQRLLLLQLSSGWEPSAIKNVPFFFFLPLDLTTLIRACSSFVFSTMWPSWWAAVALIIFSMCLDMFFPCIVMKALRMCHQLLCVSQGGPCSLQHVWIPNRLPLTFWPAADSFSSAILVAQKPLSLSPSHLQRRAIAWKAKATASIQPLPLTRMRISPLKIVVACSFN